ncbi:hypothetical protein Q7404_10320 [Glaesserella parasuis]|nr:hypothetical protein [Glaesserella parasuis]
MANITLKDITPRHFYEAVKLLKTTEYRIYTTINTIEIRLPYSDFETKEETDKRFEQMEHLQMFLDELVRSTVPIDWEEFLQQFRYKPRQKFIKR